MVFAEDPLVRILLSEADEAAAVREVLSDLTLLFDHDIHNSCLERAVSRIRYQDESRCSLAAALV